MKRRRLALKHAIDREALLKAILDGRGAPANDSPIGPANRYFNHEMPQRQYDVDQAKYHLGQAGLSSLEVNLSTSDTAFPGAVDAAVLYKEHAAKAGITINVVREPNDGYWSNVWAVKPFCFSYWAGRPTEDWIFTLAYQTGASWSESFWSNARFDELLLLARSELDEDKRREMYWEMQELVRDDGGGIIPLFANLLTARSTRIQHSEQVSASFEADGWKCIERWWMV
jgi:peptide/nickel transport system substrate-binding protein